jgi:hypothetical protein
MNFKNDFLTALRAGMGHDALMELVRRYRVQGLSVEAAYQTLHDIWLENGFDKKEVEDGTLQDALEAVMERVWYGAPIPER